MRDDKGGKSDILNLYLSRARRHRILSRKEEAALSQRIRQGDQAAWEWIARKSKTSMDTIDAEVCMRQVGKCLIQWVLSLLAVDGAVLGGSKER